MPLTHSLTGLEPPPVDVVEPGVAHDLLGAIPARRAAEARAHLLLEQPLADGGRLRAELLRVRLLHLLHPPVHLLALHLLLPATTMFMNELMTIADGLARLRGGVEILSHFYSTWCPSVEHARTRNYKGNRQVAYNLLLT